jgi:hypothetical protein
MNIVRRIIKRLMGERNIGLVRVSIKNPDGSIMHLCTMDECWLRTVEPKGRHNERKINERDSDGARHQG